MHTGQTLEAGTIKTRKYQLPILGDANVQLALQSHLSVIQSLIQQVKVLEKSILAQVTPDPLFDCFRIVPGIGDIPAKTILLETGAYLVSRVEETFPAFVAGWTAVEKVTGKRKVKTIARMVINI